MNCNEALQILLAENRKDRSAALAFILQDRQCLDRVDQLARAILSDIDNEITCAETRLHLESYYEWQQSKGEEFPLLQDVDAHVGRCPYCRLEYQLLGQAIDSVANLPVDIPLPQRSFDLSFIKTPLPQFKPTSAIWNIEQRVRRLFEQIQVAVTETTATIAALTPQLSPVPVTSALRGEDDTQFAILVLPDLEANIHFQLNTKPSRDGTALITLRIFDTESDMPITDARVQLRGSKNNLIASSLTDDNGEISFPRIAADRYLIQAIYDDKTWELPISVVHSQV